MTFDPNEVIGFDFAGIDPAEPGVSILLPSGIYNVQCIGLRKYFTGESKNEPDSTKPNLEFKFQVINHPNYTGIETKLSHSLLPAGKQFLLQTLMCLLPEKNWQQDGIKVPLGQLAQAIQGKTANAVTFHDDFKGKDGSTVYIWKIKGLKPFDPTIVQPMPDENNPPKYMLEKQPPSPVAAQAAQGVATQADVQQFMQDWPGGTPSAPTTPSPSQQAPSDFGLDPF